MVLDADARIARDYVDKNAAAHPRTLRDSGGAHTTVSFEVRTLGAFSWTRMQPLRPEALLPSAGGINLLNPDTCLPLQDESRSSASIGSLRPVNEPYGWSNEENPGHQSSASRSQRYSLPGRRTDYEC